MEKNILSQIKRIYFPVIRDFPAFRNTWKNFQAVIHLHQTVKNLIYRPDKSLVPCKCRIQRTYSLGFVIPEYFGLYFRIFISFAGKAKKDKDGYDQDYSHFGVKLEKVAGCGLRVVS